MCWGLGGGGRGGGQGGEKHIMLGGKALCNWQKVSGERAAGGG